MHNPLRIRHLRQLPSRTLRPESFLRSARHVLRIPADACTGGEVVGPPGAATPSLHDAPGTRAIGGCIYDRVAGHGPASPRSVWRGCIAGPSNFHAPAPRPGGIRAAGKAAPSSSAFAVGE